MKVKLIKYLGACTLLLNGAVYALEFKQVNPNESKVSFAYKQMGVAMEGRFNQFTTQVAFDPAKVANAQARIDIQLTSIDAGSVEANDEVVSKSWFNAKVFPTANFVSSGVKSLGGNRYEVAGKLSIKGTTREIVTPVTFQAIGTKGVFEGAFSINRLDYKIGEGAWADLGTVANEIQIKFHIVVTAVPSKK